MHPNRYWVVGVLCVMAALLVVVLTLADRGEFARETLTSDAHMPPQVADASPLVSVPDSQTRTIDTSAAHADRTRSERAPDPAQRSVIVRSSTGLHVARVATREAAGAWSDVDCPEGVLLLQRDSGTLHVRAPGHTSAVLTPTASELELEPDAQIVIEGSALRSQVREIDLAADPLEQRQHYRPELAHVLMSGFVSDERWVAAMTASRHEAAGVRRRIEESVVNPRYHRFFFPQQEDLEALFLTFGLADGRGVKLAYMPRAGARDSWRVEAPSIESAPLVVEVTDDSEAAPHELLTEIFDSRDDVATSTAEYDWGFVTLVPAANEEATESWPAGTSTFDFGPRPLARRYGVIVRASDCSVYGRRFFDHDGSVQRIALQEGITLEGRLRADDGSAGPDGASFTWGRRFPDDERPELRSGTTGFALGADGAFFLRGPDRLSRDESYPDTLPPLIELEIQASDFQPFTRVFDAGAARHFDAGTIDLGTGVCDFFIPLTTTLGGFALDGSNTLTVFIEKAPSWNAAIAASRWDARRHGTVITLERTEPKAITTFGDAPVVPPLASPAWSDTRVTSIAQRGTGGRFFVYERQHDDTFERVETVDHALNVDFTGARSDDQLLVVECVWRGLTTQSANRRVTLESLRFDATFPANEAAVWRWHLYSEPKRQGFPPFLIDSYTPTPEGKLLASGSVSATSRDMTIRIP